MRRVVISTVGTSLLTNRASKEEKDLLRDYANATWDDTLNEVQELIRALQVKSQAVLAEDNIKIIRKASAELNGIYGIYKENLHQAHRDMHFLIATDTAQGQATSEVVQKFLEDKGLTIDTFIPQALSAKSTTQFSQGISEILAWMEKTIPGYQEAGYRIIFNLVGSFKSLQGYLNTIAMFYADEIVYIFESDNAELISIPRLPIKIDTDVIRHKAVEVALMVEGAIDFERVSDLPEALLFVVEEQAMLSVWGELVWAQTKRDILKEALLDFPYLLYEDSFKRDYQNTRNPDERVKLQEILARCSYLLEYGSGDTTLLKEEGGLQYDNYTNNKQGIAHFRVTQGLRASCSKEDGVLRLRHYGSHDYVNNNP